MVEQTVSTFGRLDAAFNNAGVQSPLAKTADASADDFNRVNAINLRGVWSCMKYELLQMREQGSGAIVNCSSLGGLVDIAGRGVYHASKHGALGLTKSAALEYAAGRAEIRAGGLLRILPRWRWCHCGASVVTAPGAVATERMGDGVLAYFGFP